MSRFPYVALSLGLVACKGPSNDTNDTDDRPLIREIIALLQPGYEAPTFAAVNFGTDWQAFDLAGASSVDVPDGADAYTLVTVCDAFGGYAVDFTVATLTDVPEPRFYCPETDTNGTVHMTGSATDSTDLLMASFGNGFDTFYPGSESFGIDVVPGTYDLVLSPLGYSAATSIVAVPSLDATQAGSLGEFHFGPDALMPDTHSLTLTGEPLQYGDVSGLTINGTWFDAGYVDSFYFPPAASGVEVVGQSAFLRTNDADHVVLFGGAVGDQTVDLPAVAPFHYGAVIGDGQFAVTFPEAPPVALAQTWILGANYSETRVRILTVGQANATIPLDPASVIPGFPQAASDAMSGGEPSEPYAQQLMRLSPASDGAFGLPQMLELTAGSNAHPSTLPDELVHLVYVDGTLD